MSPSSAPFRVLYVCTGNICRSPLAERLLRRELAARLNGDSALFDVSSAGVRAMVGEAMDPKAAAALTALGGEPDGFQARSIDAEQVKQADLVLTANRKHRANVVRLDPTAAGRAFTMREFALLAGEVDLDELPKGDPRKRLATLVQEVALSRGTVRPEDRHDLDVSDPYQGTEAQHREAADLIAEATGPTADLLAAAVKPDLAANVQAAPARKPKKVRRPARRPAAGASPRRRLAVGLAAAGVPLLVVGALAAWMAWSALDAKRQLEAAEPLVTEVRTAVVDGDTAQARAATADLQARTGAARDRLDGPLWSAAESLPYAGDDVTAVRTVAEVVDDLARGILPPLVEVSEAVRPQELRVAGNRVALEPLKQAAPTLRQAAEDSKRTQTRLTAVETAGLTAPVGTAVTDLRSKVGELASTLDSAVRAADLLPPMLGADGKRRYFLAFQTNAEARGTGGLLGAYGVLEADNGRLRVLRLGPNTDLDNPSRLPVRIGPDYQAMYGRTKPWWVNGNVSAHFPYAGRIWSAMYEQQFGQKVDGVIATDPVAMGYILEATGPAQLPDGGRITAANAVELTMKEVYERFPSGSENAVRDRYLQGVAGVVFTKLLSGSGDPKALAEQLAQAADDRRLLVWSAHADEQRELEQTPLAGAVPETRRPFAGLVVNNYSGSKLDYYLDRELTYVRSSCVSADGRRESRITVTLTNNAPRSGLPPYVDQRLDLDSFKGTPPRGANTEFVQVFATRGADLVRATRDGQDLLVTGGRERGHPVFAFNVTLRAGETTTIELDLLEPATDGPVQLMKPQPLVREMSQHAAIEPCGGTGTV